ncbi:MAG TPA: response regulator [Burkholderiaceae bacterium]
MDSGIYEANALIVDNSATSRSVMAAQLRDLGVKEVRQSIHPRDARALLEHKSFDIVICAYQAVPGEMSGQDLLDELRREHVLPFSTVFVMITSEATYARVTEAAEAALDAYLVRPYTTAALAERLAQARYRKKILRDIFEAIEKGEHAAAADMCMERFEARTQFWLYAARIGAELLLRQGRHEEARKLYDAIIAARTVPWARLGVARAELAGGNTHAARRTLENLIGELPDYADSYDVMGHVLLEQGEIENALGNYRRAASLTPGCLARLQRCGTLAYYAGERGEALRLLDRAMSLGIKSKMFDLMSLVLIGIMRYDTKDQRGLRLAHEAMVNELDQTSPKSRRLERFEMVFRALRSLADRKTGEALEVTRWLTVEAQQGDFDLEAAGLLLALWMRISSPDLTQEEVETVVTGLGLRFCTSKSSTEVLVTMCEKNEAAKDELRACHTRIFGVAETAMKHSMRGTARIGVELLIQQGEATRNAKLIDMAGLVLKRQAEKIENADDLAGRIASLQERFVQPLGVNPTAKPQRREAGGLALRGL